MNLLDMVRRQSIPEPWAEGEKIPWNDPAFSARMLREHLSQEHDAASRRLALIDKHVTWIHNDILGGRPANILDLACGPGLYSHRLARLGHTCTGIDFGPASVANARQQADADVLACTFIQGDVRTTPFGDGFELVMLIFGEFNVFTAEDARSILVNASRALRPGGWLLLEPHPLNVVREIGQQPPIWSAAPHGLFSDQPHLYLRESFWDAPRQVAMERHWVIDAAAGGVTRYGASMQGYSDREYGTMLTECGIDDIQVYPSLCGEADGAQTDLIALTGRKPVSR